MPITEEKQKILKYISEKYPDMPMLYIQNFIPTRWTQEKNILDLTPKEIEECNLRKIFPDEIIIDIEEEAAALKHLESTMELLQYSYKLWQTGSRGYHASMIFPELLYYSKKERNAIRKHIIKLFNADESKSSEDTWIQLEGEKHFKINPELNKYKVLVNNENRGENKLSFAIKTEIENLRKQAVYKPEIIEDFRDFTSSPFFKWVLETKINNGDRNNILFKNLAIALVKSGFNREQILTYANQIVNNCPGTSVSSFMGWVDKAMEGELTDFNHFELIQWAGKHGHPQFFDKVAGAEKTEAILTTKDLWRNVWNNKPIGEQPIWCELLFHNVLGTVLDEKEKDMRVHVIFTSQTSSGKDEGIDLAQEVLEHLDYETSTPTDITDKTLVGGVNNIIEEYNSKHGLDPKLNTSIMKGSKELKYRDPIKQGELAHVHWMGIPESEFIFKPGPHNRQLQTILRQAMDKKRRIEKGVAGTMICINTNTSFVITTYPIADAMSKVLHNGLFQRCLYYNKIMQTHERNNIDKILQSFKWNLTLRANYNHKEWMAKLETRLKQIKSWYDLNKDKIQIYDGMDNYISGLVTEYKKTYDELPEGDKSLMDAIVTRGHNTIDKLIHHNAIYKMSSKITSEDIDEAFALLRLCFDSIKGLMNTTPTTDKKINILCNVLNGGELSTMMLHKLIENKMKIKSPNERNKLIKIAIDRGEIEVRQEGNRKFLRNKPHTEEDF